METLDGNFFMSGSVVTLSQHERRNCSISFYCLEANGAYQVSCKCCGRLLKCCRMDLFENFPIFRISTQSTNFSNKLEWMKNVRFSWKPTHQLFSTFTEAKLIWKFQALPLNCESRMSTDCFDYRPFNCFHQHKLLSETTKLNFSLNFEKF